MEDLNKLHVTRSDTGSVAPTPPPLEHGNALFLDFDGTLAELAATPEAVEPPPGLAALVEALHARLSGAVAIVTGRRLEALDRYFAPLRPAGAGLHGLQLRLAAGADPQEVAPHPGVAELTRRLQARFGSVPGLRIEDKGGGVALHYRLAPAYRLACEDFMRHHAPPLGLELVAGHAVIEARPPGVNKGEGLRQLLGLPSFSGRRPVFVGDDRTDEDAIVAAQALGGCGIRVGEQPSAARYRLADVRAVHRWLQISLALLQREGGT